MAKGDVFTSPLPEALHRGGSRSLLRLANRAALGRLAGLRGLARGLRLADDLRLASGLLRRLALGGLAGRLLRRAAGGLASGGFLRGLLSDLLYLLSQFRFLIFTCVCTWVGWELFDSPRIFFAEFGL